MDELHDTSSIPDEPAYWDALTSRIASTAAQRSSAVAWVGSRQIGWLTAACAAAAAAIAMAAVIATARPRQANGTALLASVLVPNDAVGRVLAAASSPPSVSALQPAGVPRAEAPR
ncbi:MAG TPA: hypothetical protein VJR24_01310 [Gemmatimonadaceae bacterium]|nr:hypothetical protein [Gemmatimonadaceae bacterium]